MIVKAVHTSAWCHLVCVRPSPPCPPCLFVSRHTFSLPRRGGCLVVEVRSCGRVAAELRTAVCLYEIVRGFSGFSTVSPEPKLPVLPKKTLVLGMVLDRRK